MIRTSMRTASGLSYVSTAGDQGGVKAADKGMHRHDVRIKHLPKKKAIAVPDAMQNPRGILYVGRASAARK